MTKHIELSNGGVVLVDDADFSFLSQFSWRAKKSDGSSNKLHAVRDVSLGDRKITVRMHRLVCEADKDQIVYHINGDTLDNRRRNLQIRTVNPWTGRPEESGFVGVHQIGTSIWKSEIEFAGNKYPLGVFHSPEEAAHIYDSVARKLYGRNAITNF